MALLVISVLAIFGTILTLFFTSERITGDIFSTEEVPAASSPEFIETIAHIANNEVRSGGSVETLNNGDAFIKSFISDIENAKDTITITNYIWEKGEFSDALFKPLLERARAGVRILILLDDLGGNKAPDDKLEELRNAGGDYAHFRKPRIGSLTNYTNRTHRRAIVIDGQIGYIGGIAFHDDWLGNADQPDRWRDSMIRITGPLVPQVQNAFAQLWAATTGEILGPRFYPPAPQDSEGIKTIGILSSTAADTQNLPLIFWYSFATAKKSIYITNPYFLPLPTGMKALEEAARRGVDVRILVPSHLTDAKYVRWASQDNYEPLLKAGAKIYEYQRSRLHVKTLVVDGVWTVAGSANMDIRSALLNEENVIGVQDPEFGAKMEEIFFEDLKDAKEINKEEWQKRNPLLRALQLFSKIFQKQF